VENVTFDYGRGEVLHGVSLEVPAGSKVAIVGRSGGGKTTLLSILRGSLPIQGGHIKIGGRNIADLQVPDIRALTATVSQNTWLFTGTVADNVRIAAPEASEEEIWDALRRVHVADDVAAMPQGLYTDVGEQGVLISGGQAQRLSLARALLSGRKILLLDEPTSQVDRESERAIIEAIKGFGPEWTLLIVTHRRALLEVADAAYEMKHGELHPMELSEGALR
jgi:ATP-binding cassette subfamily C protein